MKNSLRHGQSIPVHRTVRKPIFSLALAGVVGMGAALDLAPTGWPCLSVAAAQIQGTETLGDDEITGTEGPDSIDGRTGNDRIFGLGGNDSLIGGLGDDYIEGGEGRDFIRGGEGNDKILAGFGNDKVKGGGGRDMISGEEGDDELGGGDGDDFIEGGPGNDILHGGPGADEMDGGPGNDELKGEENGDTLIGGGGADVFQYQRWKGGKIDRGDKTKADDFAPDQIKDFSLEQGDRIDISDYLHFGGYVGDGSAESLKGFVRQQGTMLQIDANGGGDEYVDIVDIHKTFDAETLATQVLISVKK